jgi:hypothetical protein
MAKQQQQIPLKPQPASVADAEAVIADLEEQRARLIAAREKDDRAMSAVAYQAHALHDPEANKTLDEIVEKRIRHDQRLREVDAAIATAKKLLEEARASERREAERKAAMAVRAEIKNLKAAGQQADCCARTDNRGQRYHARRARPDSRLGSQSPDGTAASIPR